jgi:phage gp36-like protein
MAYFSQTDLERAIGVSLVLRLLDDDNDGVVDASALGDLIEDADAEVNGYVSALFSVDTLAANPPPAIRRLAVDVGVQLAYLRRPEFIDERGQTPWQGRYDRAVKRLREVSKGEFRLDVNGTPAQPANVRGAGLYTSEGRADLSDQGFVKGGSGDF